MLLTLSSLCPQMTGGINLYLYLGRDRGNGRGGRGRSDAKTEYNPRVREDYNPKGREGKTDQNPIGPDGKRMKCFNCESIKHLSQECPHKQRWKKVGNTAS